MKKSAPRIGSLHPVKTVLAVVSGIIIVAICSIVIPGGICLLCNPLKTPPNISVSVLAIVISAVIGVYASRLGCDKALRGYSHRAVFWVFMVLVIAAIAFELCLCAASMGADCQLCSDSRSRRSQHT